MMPPHDTATLLALSARLCCIGILFQSLELIALWRELRAGCLLGWRGGTNASRWWRRMWQRTQAFPASLVVLLVRSVAAGLCLLLPFGHPAFAWLAGLLLIAQLYYNRRFQLIFANFDHMNLVCLAAITVGGLPHVSPAVRLAALAFVAFQALLGYVAGGVDKLASADWRNGLRLAWVFQDSAHRLPALGGLLARRRNLALMGSWSVILLELSFPVCLVLPSAGFWAFMVGGLLFHFAIAVTMGLPGFFWAFGAAYPALYFMHEWMAGLLHG